MNTLGFARTQHIISAATGHQVSNRGGAKFSISGKDYFTSRNQKLKQQFTAAPVDPANANVKEHQTDRKETFVLQSKIFGELIIGFMWDQVSDNVLF